MEIITYVNLTKRFGTTIVQQPITVTEDVKIGNTTKTTRKKRLIQYVEDLDTIYVDEQIKIMGGVTPSATAVYIQKGKLSTDEDDTSLIKFMDAHPHNQANGGNEFKKLNVEQEDLFEIKKFQKTSEISNLVMDGEDNLVRSIAVWFLGIGSIDKTPNSIKKALYIRMQQDYDFVLEVETFIKSKSNDERLMITLALSNNVIQINDGRKIAWKGSDESLFVGSQSKDLVEEFSLWMKTDVEGRETLKLIADKLDKEPKNKSK